jgi:hypothetical protein
MLHRVNRPQCGTQMKSVYRLQYKVLAFACSTSALLLFSDQSVFVEKFGQRWGEWLFERISHNKKFNAAFTNLVRHINGDALKRHMILQAFLNDTRFHLRLNDATFGFQYRSLDQETKDLLKDLMELFYDDLLETGFPVASSNSYGKFTRNDFRKAFWDANDGVDLCPACDGPKPPSRFRVVQSENDHFFPKSIYPFLAVHFSNLLPVCKYCNQSFKRSADPIDQHDNQPLRRSFFPYEMPAAERVQVVVSRSNTGERDVAIEAKDNDDTIRATNLDRLLSLKARWRDELQRVIGELIEEFIRASDLRYRLGEHQTIPIIELLRVGIRSSRLNLGRKSGDMLKLAYLELALNDAKESSELQNELNRTLQIYLASSAGI